MKTMKFLTYATFVLFLGLSVSSCSEDGADGVDGADGAIGAVGATGANGTDGNANVIYSDWAAPTWAVGAFYGVAVQEYTYTVPVTQDMVDHSAVLMYWKNAAGYVWQLPLGILDSSVNLDYTYSLNTIYLYAYNEANTSVAPIAFNSSNLFKYVIIEGSVPAGKAADSQEAVYNELTAANVDVNDYYEVCAYYGINPE